MVGNMRCYGFFAERVIVLGLLATGKATDEAIMTGTHVGKLDLFRLYGFIL